jgi:excisionase family DNA binding protein
MAADATDLTIPADTIDDVKELLGVQRRTAYRLAEQGKIPFYRVGGKMRFDLAEVAAAIRATRTGPS